MKFAFVSTMGGVPWAGSEELWWGAAMRLLDAGHHVAANCVGHDTLPEKLAKFESKGGQLHRRQKPSRAIRLVDRVRGASASERGYQWLDQVQPDRVVISQSCQDGVGWGAACASRGISFDLITQVVAEYYWPNDTKSAEAGEVLAKARRCYFVSKGNVELTERQLGVSLANAEVVWNPFNVVPPQSFHWPEESPLRIACVARLDPRHKGQDLLLQGLAGRKWRHRRFELTFFGTGPCQESLRRLSTKLDLHGIQFAGHVNDVRTIWDSHHVLVLTSRVEGMPLAAIEAMICGRPCLLTDVAGNAELIRDGETGFLADSASVRAVSDSLERMWNAREALRSMGERAYMWTRRYLPGDPADAMVETLLAEKTDGHSMSREVA